MLIRIDLESVRGELAYLVISVLEKDGAIAVLESPHKGEAVRVAVAAFAAKFGKARSILAKDNGIVFFAACDSWIERVECSVVVIEASFLISPGGTRKQV